MTPRAGDPRTQRTVAALRAALRGSLRTRTLDEISVSELCREADVRRTTFYTHFASVPDLLTEMLTDDIDERLGLDDTTGMSLTELADEFQRTLVAAFDVVADERELFRAGLSSTTSATLPKALLDMFQRRVEIALDLWRDHGSALGVDRTVAVMFSAGGLTAATTAWAVSSDTDSACWAASVRDQMPPWWPRPVPSSAGLVVRAEG